MLVYGSSHSDKYIRISEAMRPDDTCCVLLQGRNNKWSQLCHGYELDASKRKQEIEWIMFQGFDNSHVYLSLGSSCRWSMWGDGAKIDRQQGSLVSLTSLERSRELGVEACYLRPTYSCNYCSSQAKVVPPITRLLPQPHQS